MKRGLKDVAAELESLWKGPVTTVSPMKRGLKDVAAELESLWKGPVTTVSPMKRGLKDIVAMDVAESRKRYNRFPDEKGTERRSRTVYSRH